MSLNGCGGEQDIVCAGFGIGGKKGDCYLKRLAALVG